MASRLIIEQEPLKVGQVRKVTSNNGEKNRFYYFTLKQQRGNFVRATE